MPTQVPGTAEPTQNQLAQLSPDEACGLFGADGMVFVSPISVPGEFRYSLYQSQGIDQQGCCDVLHRVYFTNGSGTPPETIRVCPQTTTIQPVPPGVVIPPLPPSTPGGPAPTPPATPPACIPICAPATQPQTQPPAKPPPTKCDYTAWCSAATGTLYVVRSDQPSRGASDTKLASGDPTEWNWQQLNDKCGGSLVQPAPEGPAGVVPVQFPAACGEFGGAPGARIPGSDVGLAQILGLVDANGQPWQPFPNAGVTDIAQNVANSFLTAVTFPLLQAAQIAQGVLSGSGCYDGVMGGLIGGDTVLGMAERWLGVDLTTFRIPNAYNRHFKCPVLLPTIPEAASAWLAGEIDEPTLQCWVAANNGRYPEISTAIRAQRTKLSPVQYGMLYMRDKITPDQFDARLRSTGMIKDTDREEVLDLLQQLPPPSDIVRMMVRDAADEALVAQFRLDDQFTDKFTGKVEEWTRQQGIDPTYMRFLWRSHWSIPSPGQLADMLHRLSRLPPGDPAYVDLETVRRALTQQDIAPFWVDKFIATSYRPLTRIDARRAYENGALDDAGLVESYLNLGYDSTNAQTLLEFNKRVRLLKFAKSPHVKEYANGELNGAQLDEQLKIEGATDEIVQFVHQQLPAAMDKLRRSRCLKALRLRYLQGDQSQEETQQAIQSQGLDADQVQSILSGWSCEKDARGKAIPAGELCTMFAQGSLTIPDLVTRLQRIGYAYDDAVLMARRCATTTQQKMTAAEQKQLKAQQAADQKQARALARSAAQEARAVRQGQQLAEKAAALRVAREKRLIEAGEKFSKHFQGSLSDAIIAVKAMYNQFASASLYTQDEIINALLVVTGSKQVADIPSLSAAVQTALAAVAIPASQLPPETPSQTPTPPLTRTAQLGTP